jgi:Domain of unknown function (DUF4960)
MKRINFFLFLFAFTGILMTSCKKEETAPEAAITTFSITSPFTTVGVINESAKTIAINVPFGTNLTKVVGAVTGTSGATITPNLASGVDFSSKSVVFTITNGATVKTYTANVTVGANPLRLALVGTWKDVASIDDAEIKKAYDWAIKTYGEKAGYFAFDKLTAADIATAKVIWWHHTMFPRPAKDADIIPATAQGAKTVIGDFYKGGGNLLLTGLSGSYVSVVGRILAADGPTNLDIGGDKFITNPDDWGISFKDVKNASDYPDNNETSYLFKGLTTKSVTFDGNTYDAVMLSGPGNKKNRAHIWDFNKFFPNLDGGDKAPNARKDAWAKANTALVRSSFEWDPSLNGVELGAIVEFTPTATFKGTSLVIGLGAYEWNIEGGGTNTRQNNVEGITKNALDNFINN